jgi:ParB family chromosome partitioning protein
MRGMAAPRKKKAASSDDGAAPKRRRTKKADPASRGLAATEVSSGSPSPALEEAASAVLAAGGAVLARYREPLGGHWVVFASLPIDKVAPTPYQRDLSESHVKKLAVVVDKLDRFLDPVIAVPTDEGTFHTPNGHHRLAAMRGLGAKAIPALVVPEREVAFQILALNTEKAHNLKERSLEVIRMARDLAKIDADAKETAYAFQFEDPTFVTLGICYEERPRFGGGAYAPALRRADEFLEQPFTKALPERERRAKLVLRLDEVVTERIGELKEKGFQSPYLRAFVLARINPLRFKRGARMEFDELLGAMTASAEKFDVAKVQAKDISAASGPPGDD